jgi:uncharacterized protein YbdZ (MbtH family)
VAKFRTLTFESRQAYVKVVNRASLASLWPTAPTAKTSAAKSDVTQAAVVVRHVPKFFLWPEDKNVRLNDEAIIECLASNDASIHADLNAQNVSESVQFFKYKWLKDGVALDFK